MKSKRKITKRIEKNQLISTVDIGKSIHYGYCRCPDGSDIKTFPFENNMKGFNKFWSKITDIQRSKGIAEVVVGFESTGSYGEPLKHFLNNKEVKLLQVNPMHTKRLKDLEGNSPNKTDQKDPKVIADILQLNHGLRVIIPKGIIADLRYIIHAREKKLDDINRVKNRLESKLAILFPEFLLIMKGLRSKSSIYLLENYPAPASIKKLGVAQLTRELREISRGKLGEKRAEALYEASKNTIGVKEGLKGMVAEIAMYIEQLILAEHQLCKIEAEIKILLERIPESKLLLSMRGIGEITAASFISEIVDFKAFSTIPEIIKLSGLNLYEISSGRHKGKHRITKTGRSLLRKMLYYAALNMIRKNGIFYEDYQKHLAKGMEKPKAIIAISKKILKTIFAMVRDNKEYIENYKLFLKAA